MNEEDRLQYNAESGDLSGEGVDARAYQKVFAALAREPNELLPTYFADNVIGIIEARNRIRFSRIELLCFGFVMFILLIILLYAILVTGFSMNWGFLSGIGRFAPVFAFGLSMLLLFHVLDRRLLEKLNTRS